MKTRLMLGLVIMLVGAAAIVLVVAQAPRYFRPNEAPEAPTCYQMGAYFQGEYGLYRVGQTELCGTDLHWKRIFGPSYEDIIVDLRNELGKWKDCVTEKVCYPYMGAWWERD